VQTDSRLWAVPTIRLQVDQVFTPHGHYVNLYINGPEQLYHMVAFHKSPALPVQITWTTNHPPPPSFQQVWLVKTFALRYRINHPTPLERAADELRRALQRGRVEVVSRPNYPPEADGGHGGRSTTTDSLDHRMTLNVLYSSSIEFDDTYIQRSTPLKHSHQRLPLPPSP
jgi:hypothetical protein